jgi:hypothetical protein
MEKAYIGSTPITDVFVGDFLSYGIVSGTPITPIPITTLGIEYLVVAGGGGAGNDNAGGGGAGGLLSGSATIITGSILELIIGAGGAINQNGKNSSLISASLNVISIGGGRGGSNGTGSNGGSGGGGSFGNLGGSGSFGPPIQGYPGGNSTLTTRAQGGGGGASQSGSNGGISIGGAGGSGSIWLDGIFYAGGGGGGGKSSGAGGLGGPGGGGNATNDFNNPDSGSAGVDGLGGGGGGSFTGNPGGSGIVKIRYAGTGSQATGGTITFVDGYTYHTFTSVATSSFTF